MDFADPNINRLLDAFAHREADRVPTLEFWVTSQAVYEHVLGRPLSVDQIDAAEGESAVTPEDDVELAARLGMDAVGANFAWRPNNVFNTSSVGDRHYVDGEIKTPDDLTKLTPPPKLPDQLNRLERYLRAAEGTGVGCYPNFTSLFDSTYLAMGYETFMFSIYDRRELVLSIMDRLLENQVRAVEEVCRQYGNDIAFIFYNDDIACSSGLMIRPDIFREMVLERMKVMLAPARALGKPIVTHTDGDLREVIPMLLELGVCAVHPVEPAYNDIYALNDQYAGRMAFIGNIDVSLLASGPKETIENDVRRHLDGLKKGGGYVLGSSTSIFDGIPPENFVTMIRTAQEWGRYGA